MLFDQYKEFLAALRFLSIISLPGSMRLFKEEEAGTRLIIGGAYFPVIGLILALLLGFFTLLITHFFPTLIIAALLVIAQVLLTGGLHLDGLMDSCDGLFGGTTREHKLEIMHDSRVGSFGVLGGVCVLLLRFACFASLTGHQLFLAFFMVLPTTRWGMVLLLYLFPNARTSGLGSAYSKSLSLQHVIAATIISLLAAIIAGHIAGVIIWVLVTLAGLGLGVLITNTLGGLTGDSYGAIEEVTNVLALLGIVLLRTWI